MSLTASFKPLSIGFLAAASLWGGVTFSDGTFNLADYSMTTWKTDPTIQIAVQQTQNGGNPGQALEIVYNLSPSEGKSMVGLSRPSFIYNPATQGVIRGPRPRGWCVRCR